VPIKSSIRTHELAIMSDPASAATPVYVLKWKMDPKERGRHHMAVFVPNLAYKDAAPSTEECFGTLFQVKGSPLARFMHEIRRDWNRQDDTGVESVHLICQVGSQHAPDDSMANITMDQTALMVRPPGISQPLWDAVSHSPFFVSTCLLSCD
jgi:hypothetical protein